MKKVLFSFSILFCLVVITIIGCKKNSNNIDDSSSVAIAKVQSVDASDVQGESEDLDEEVNTLISASERFSGSGNTSSGTGTISPDADTTNTAGARSITITFNGTTNPANPCRKRTGSITIELLNANRWVDSGAVLKCTFNNYKVENTCRHKSILVNGERMVTNVFGGNLYTLSNGTTNKLTHKIRTGASGVHITFTDSTGSLTAVWNVAKRRFITHVPGSTNYTLTTNGDTSINGNATTESWGLTRYGGSFLISISNSVIANTECKLWRPKSGLVSHIVGNFYYDIQYGVNALGNTVSTGCPEYYKVSWTNAAGINGTAIVPYN